MGPLVTLTRVSFAEGSIKNVMSSPWLSMLLLSTRSQYVLMYLGSTVLIFHGYFPLSIITNFGARRYVFISRASGSLFSHKQNEHSIECLGT